MKIFLRNKIYLSENLRLVFKFVIVIIGSIFKVQSPNFGCSESNSFNPFVIGMRMPLNIR